MERQLQVWERRFQHQNGARRISNILNAERRDQVFDGSKFWAGDAKLWSGRPKIWNNGVIISFNGGAKTRERHSKLRGDVPAVTLVGRAKV